jgi:GT2 family glycosyltransferase
MISSSIVIYNSKRKDLQTVIACAASSIVDLIYVVDNAPNDNYRNIVQNLSSKIIYIQGHGNVGYGAAHNIAMRGAIQQGAKYHLILNPDIEFSTDVVERLRNYMNANMDVGQVMPRIICPKGELQYLCKLIPTPSDLIFKRFLSQEMNAERANKFQLKFTGYKKIMNVPYLSGCFMFFRVSALKEIGLFDERFFMYPEDIDLTRRMHKVFKTIYYPDVTVIHAHASESYRKMKMLIIHIINIIKYFNKWGWFFDKERKKINEKVLAELMYFQERNIL